MTDRCEIFRKYRATILLSTLKISTLFTIFCGFYASPNAQNRMCELCTFSQIQSHILNGLIHSSCTYKRAALLKSGLSLQLHHTIILIHLYVAQSSKSIRSEIMGYLGRHLCLPDYRYLALLLFVKVFGLSGT